MSPGTVNVLPASEKLSAESEVTVIEIMPPELWAGSTGAAAASVVAAQAATGDVGVASDASSPDGAFGGGGEGKMSPLTAVTSRSEGSAAPARGWLLRPNCTVIVSADCPRRPSASSSSMVTELTQENLSAVELTKMIFDPCQNQADML